jgi:DtxR family Mn-dependent transcriptional regulator
MSSPQATLSDSLQDYLEAVCRLAERDGVARMKAIAEMVGVSTSSATAAVQGLAERGLVNYDPYQFVTPTASGAAAGRELLRKHRVLKQFLMRVLGVPEAEAEEVGCKLEHAVKGEVLERLVQFLRFVESEGGPDGAWIESFRAFCRDGGAAAVPAAAETPPTPPGSASGGRTERPAEAERSAAGGPEEEAP